MLSEFSPADPFRVVYVSTIDVFKHQWAVVEAVRRLHGERLPIRLDLYGSARTGVLPRLTRVMDQVDAERKFIHYWGEVYYKDIHQSSADVDICVVAFICENM